MFWRCWIMLLSHDLELGGPALALFHSAKVLKKNGYQVMAVSMLDGLLRDQLLQETIPVVVDVNLQIETMVNADWIHGFDLILCNTVNYHVFLIECDENVPILWWFHDSEFFYHSVRQEVLQLIRSCISYKVKIFIFVYYGNKILFYISAVTKNDDVLHFTQCRHNLTHHGCSQEQA